jgi:hypothetical protein
LKRRRHERFVRRLETEFSADGKEYRAISSDFSCGGIFIRTHHAFPPGTLLDIVIHLPEGFPAKVKGRVRRALQTPIATLKNGMGIELIEKDGPYLRFMRSLTGECEGEAGASEKPAEFLIVTCGKCNVKNKVDKSRIAAGPKCGRCGHSLVSRA